MQILVVVALIQKANCRHWVRYSGGPLGVKEVFVRKLRGSVRGCSLDIYLFGFHIYLEHLKRLTFFQDRVWPSTRSCSNRDDWKTLCLVQQQHHHQQQYLQKRQWVVGDVWCGSCQVVWKPTCGTISGRRNHFWFWKTSVLTRLNWHSWITTRFFRAPSGNVEHLGHIPRESVQQIQGFTDESGNFDVDLYIFILSYTRDRTQNILNAIGDNQQLRGLLSSVIICDTPTGRYGKSDIISKVKEAFEVEGKSIFVCDESAEPTY